MSNQWVMQELNHIRHAKREPEVRVTLDMISAGQEAYYSFDPDREDPEALIFKIIYRALKIAERDHLIKAGARL